VSALGECVPEAREGADRVRRFENERTAEFAPVHLEPDTSVRGRPGPPSIEPPAPLRAPGALSPHRPSLAVEEPLAPLGHVGPAPSFAPGATVPLQPLFTSMREPDAPPAGVPHTRGVLFRSSYRVLGARHGAAWVAMVSRRYPALAQALQPQSTLLSWHPTELYVTMLKAIAQSGRDAATFARELGRVATAATFSRFFGADPSLLTPWHVLEAADLFWRRYHTWGTVAVRRREPDGADVIVIGGPREPLVCASTAGVLEEVVRMAGATRADVDHPICEAAGQDACVFALTWQLSAGAT
jgi:uncharacterized protein (TIGR02265 family)